MEIEKLHQLYLESSGVGTDTRSIKRNSIFFALKGESFNANLFAIEALEKGASYAVIDEKIIDFEKYSDRLILVEDVLVALQNLSGFHRQLLSCPVLAITGSNGKTTTKELIAAVLSKKFKTIATVGNLNNHIGVPLTLLSMPLDTEFAVVEMGANHQKEIEGYCKYAAPNFGMITNIGKAHLEGFGGIEGVAKGKSELYQYLQDANGKVFVNGDDDVLLKNLFSRFKKQENVILYGSNIEASKQKNSTLGKIVSKGEMLSVEIAKGEKAFAINTHLVGDYNFPNLMAAVCIGQYFGVEDAAIKNAIEGYEPSNNRSQKIIQGTNTIILDAYNANPSSMILALENFGKLEGKNKIAVIGEMLELGDSSFLEHQKIAHKVIQMKLLKSIFVGEGFSFLKDKEGVIYFQNSSLLKEWYALQNFENTTQLIKGSRKNGLEKLLQ